MKAKKTIQRSRALQAALVCAGLLAGASALRAATPLLDFEFNEGTGPTTTDSVNKLVGILGGANANAVAAVSDSPSGAAADKAISFNFEKPTSQGFLAVDDSNGPILSLATNAFTMETWIKLDPTDARVYEGIGAYGGAIKMGLNNQQLIFTLFGIVDIPSGFFVPLDGTWHHVAAAWQPGVGVTMYMDGTPTDIPETRLPRAFSNNILTIGAEGVGGVALQGSLDRFRIHKRVLAANELDSVANAPKAALADTLVAYAFNESAPPFASSGTAARPAALYRSPIPTFVKDTPSGKTNDFAMHFEAGQQIAVDDSNMVMQLDPADPSFTLQAWVKMAGKPAARSVFFFSNGPGGAISFSVNTDRSVFVTTLGIKDASSKAIIPDDGGWHHIAVVHENGKELRYYVDGILADTVPYTGGVIFTRTNTTIYLGSEPTGGLQFVGSVDRLKVTSGILSAAELDSWPIPGVQPGSPPLSIATVELISWPTTPAGYKLQRSLDVGPAKTWTDATNTPSVGSGTYFILAPPTEPKVFYRLFKP